MKAITALGVLIMLAVTSAQAKPRTRVIYGDDNRKDVYQEKDSRAILASDSTVALILKNDVNRINDYQSQINAPTLQSSQSLCADEPFGQQPAAANCSGFLVGDDTIVTAGHCVDVNDCADYAYVFGFSYVEATGNPSLVNNKDIYNCQKVIKRVYNPNTDFAIVKLDRKVENRAPLRLANSQPAQGDKVAVIGHPSGLPTKIADGAQVRTIDQHYFVANMDTYGGNSGSAVFNADTYEVIGILVRGEQDYAYDRKMKCYRSNICTDDTCRGEDATHITEVIPFL